MTASMFGIWAIKAVILILILLTGFAYATYYERKAIARIQARIGPNRAGPWGLLQPVADGVKLIFKEEFIPAKADKVLFTLAPIITVIPAFLIGAVIPWGGEVPFFGRTAHLYLADINVATLYIVAVGSLAVYGIVLAGWSSNNKYSLLGGLRSAAQMVSYELALGLALVGPILLAGSMSLVKIVEAQKHVWYILYQPLGFVIFVIAAFAEINRSPFDLPEAEQELTGGYHTEYSGMRFALFFMAEYIKVVAMSAIIAALFLGGYYGPGVEAFPWLGPVYMFLKILALVFFAIWTRATLPRLRYDRLMAFGWKVLFPLALLNVFLTAIGIVVLGG
ncbi:MAG TPA: NADH-quinone oxidoreductase subunit NuoH [Chloroflexi bacterium]|nr:NADH-quinone oxidoreductase subunit NuoH [Chloroflexota bacterium]